MKRYHMKMIIKMKLTLPIKITNEKHNKNKDDIIIK